MRPAVAFAVITVAFVAVLLRLPFTNTTPVAPAPEGRIGTKPLGEVVPATPSSQAHPTPTAQERKKEGEKKEVREKAEQQRAQGQRAEEDHRTVLVKETRSLATTYSLRGLIHLDKKDYDLAIQDFTRAIELEPVAAYYMHRAACQWKKKAYREAIDDALQAVTIDPNNENAHWQLVSYYSARGESVLANYYAERMRALRKR